MQMQTDSKEWMNQEEAAKHIGGKPGTLRVWRTAKTGPAYHKRGGVVRYLRADLDAWLEAGRVDPSAQETGQA